MADSIDSNVVDEVAKAPEAAPEQGTWIVVAGTVKDASGDAVKGCAPVVEAGLAEDDAKARAEELSGRAMDGAAAKCAALVLAEEGSFQAAPFEEWFSAKALKERGMPYDEARADADKGAAQDAKPRAVVVAVPISTMAKAAIAAACAVAAIAVVAACALAFQQPATLESDVEPASTLEEAQDGPTLREVSVTLKAEGAEDAAVDATYELTDADGEVVDEGSIAAGEPIGFELEDGSYAFELLTAPVLEDGTTYRLPDEPTAIEVSEGMEKSGFEIELEAIAADDMTKEQLEAVAVELEEAGASDAAAAARENAASAPSVAGSADSVKRDPAPSGGSSQGSSNSGSSSSGSGSGSSDSGSSAPSAPSGGDGSSSAPSEPDPEPSAPVHEHSWVAQTEQRYVVDQAAYDEQVPYSVWKCLKCGATFDSAAAAAAHQKEMSLSGDRTHNGTVLTEYNVIHHPEVGHYETVTIGYKCSGCGAWQ